MADKTITDLTEKTTLEDADLFEIVDSTASASKKAQLSNIGNRIFTARDTDDLTGGTINLYFTHSLSQDLECNNNNLLGVKTITADSEVVETFASTKTIIFSSSKKVITLTGNMVLTLAFPGVGSSYRLRVIQDATGGHTITYNNLDSKQLTAPELKTDANGETIVVFDFNGTTAVAQGFKVE